MFSSLETKRFSKIETPFYYYDLKVLEKTLQALVDAMKPHGFHTHYALKANVNTKILNMIHGFGLGADCVSGNEILRALEIGFTPKDIVFAGVGKSDKEMNIALSNDIHCFNCESIAEMDVLNELAGKMGKTARIALRINPDLDAKTHKYITTGKEENKFGIHLSMLDGAHQALQNLAHIELIGIHMHIGSQVTDMTVFEKLANRANELQRWFAEKDVVLEHINLGGGLGVDYQNPQSASIADFTTYFNIFAKHLERRNGQHIYFELGRSIVAQSGSLISRVLYVKKGLKKQFVVLDAGMTELIRPALYQAAHHIENISSEADSHEYDVVGPICESSDCFARNIQMPETKRGDLIALRTAGAYGEVMASRYNLRDIAHAVYSE
ncbi:MAG: diaminopimelate decarboxylase [Calditrichia bacterium]